VFVHPRCLLYQFPTYLVQAAVLWGSTDIFVGGRLRLSCGRFTFWLRPRRSIRGLRSSRYICGSLRW